MSEVAANVVNEMISSKETGESAKLATEIDLNEDEAAEGSLDSALGDVVEPPTPEAKPEEERMSARFAALARRERLLVDRERKLKEGTGSADSFKKDVEGLRNDPIAFLEKYGVKLDDVLHHALGSKREPSTDEKLKKLQDRIDRQEKERTEREERNIRETNEKNIQLFQDNIKKHVEDNPEKFELIRENNAHDTVFEVVEEYFKKTGKVMAIDEAASKVEEYLDGHLERIARNSKKLAAKLGYVKDSQEKKTATPLTLTNRANGNSSGLEEKRLLSNEESLKKAAALIKWSN